MSDLEKRIEAIEARNRKVEADKAWETSWARRITLTVLTYIVFVVYLFLVNDSHPWLGAAAPAIGYLVSTLVVRHVKEIWQKSVK